MFVIVCYEQLRHFVPTSTEFICWLFVQQTLLFSCIYETIHKFQCLHTCTFLVLMWFIESTPQMYMWLSEGYSNLLLFPTLFVSFTQQFTSSTEWICISESYTPTKHILPNKHLTSVALVKKKPFFYEIILQNMLLELEQTWTPE